PRRRRVPGRRRGSTDLEPVVVVDDVEQLGVGMEVLLTRVRVRRIHVGRHGVRDHLAVGAVLRPPGMGLLRSLPITPSKFLPSPGPYRCPSTLSRERFWNNTTAM